MYTYDALDRLTLASDDDYQFTRVFDSVGNLLSESQGYTATGQEKWKTVSTGWNSVGASINVTYPSGRKFTHNRDAIDRLLSIVETIPNVAVTTHTWQGVGRKATTTHQNGTMTEYAWDGFARIQAIDHQTPSAQTFHNFEYAYDKAHNRRMEQNSFNATWLATLPTAVQTFLGARNGKGDVYAYDRAYRMVDARYDVTNPQTEVNSPGSQTYVQLVGYTLDGLGNRSQVQTTLWGGAPATTTYASDVVNQYTAVGGVTRAHDSNGNLTDDGTHQYLYDFKNRLVEVKLKSSGATVSTYRYDARGRRVEKDVGGTVTRYILDGVTVVEEFDGTDTWQASYIHGDRIDHPCAMDRADIADVDGDANTTEVLRFHYAQNALGSVSEMTSPSGAVVEWVTYDVYGLPTVRDQNGNVVASSAVGNPFLYTGREWDVECGKYFYRARTYDPEKGRFLQRDPLGLSQGLNLYRYVRNRPADFTDPSGLRDPDDPRFAGGNQENSGRTEKDRNEQRELEKAAAGAAASSSGGGTGGGNDGAQYKKLSKREIEDLKKKLEPGETIEKIKQPGGKNAGGTELVKDAKGNISVRPAGSSGAGEPTGHNVNERPKGKCKSRRPRGRGRFVRCLWFLEVFNAWQDISDWVDGEIPSDVDPDNPLIYPGLENPWYEHKMRSSEQA